MSTNKRKQGNQRYKNRSRRRPPRQPAETIEHVPKRYGVVFYDSVIQAKEDLATLLERAKTVEQLNIVIKAEGPIDEPDLNQYGKVYAGEAWTLIHQRRHDDGWYDVPH